MLWGETCWKHVVLVCYGRKNIIKVNEINEKNMFEVKITRPFSSSSCRELRKKIETFELRAFGKRRLQIR